MSVWQPRPPSARALNHAMRSASRRGVICGLHSISLLSRWFRAGPFGRGAHVELAGDDAGDETGGELVGGVGWEASRSAHIASRVCWRTLQVFLPRFLCRACLGR